MNVRCPTCETVYRVDPGKIPESGVRARCTACSNVIAVELAATAASTQPTEGASLTALPDWVSAAERVEEPAPTSEYPTAPEWMPAEHGPEEVETIPVPEEAETLIPDLDTSEAPVAPVLPEFKPFEAAAPAPPEAFEAPTYQTPDPVEAPEPEPPAPPTQDMAEPVIPEETLPSEPVAPEKPRLSRPFSFPTTPKRPSAASPMPSAPVFRPTPSPPVRPAPVVPANPTPSRTPAAPINPFLSRDPRRKARRLARALISDMIVYQPEKRQRALRDGNLSEAFDEEIKKSWEEYVDQVGEDVAKSTAHFNEALNEILAGGQKIF